MKIGFTGTQRGTTELQIRSLREILENMTGELHHGDCVGADAEAHDVARSFGLRVVVHPPIKSGKRAWKKGDETREPREYLERNGEIVLETEMLVATPGEFQEQLRSGTWSTVRRARRMGGHIVIVFPDGSVRREGELCLL